MAKSAGKLGDHVLSICTNQGGVANSAREVERCREVPVPVEQLNSAGVTFPASHDSDVNQC